MHVYPVRFAAFRGLDTLAVKNRRTRLGVTSLLSHCLHQGLVDRFPQSVAAPTPEVAIHGLPRREGFRQHPPPTASAQDIEKSIRSLAVGHARASATETMDVGAKWEQRLEHRPELIAHMKLGCGFVI